MAQNEGPRPPPPELFQGPNLSRSALSATRSSPPQTPVERPRLIRTSTWSEKPPTTAKPREKNETTGDRERVEALWAQMQLTLEEVELSAQATTHVFGAAHNSALEDLRQAQIELAKTWNRAEAEDSVPIEQASSSADSPEKDDFIDAGTRRQENARLHAKVRADVSSLVAKLDGVAEAMTKVERESRESWADSDD